MEWLPLDAFRLMKNHPSGFIIVKPKDEPDSTPLFCSICGFPNLTPDDVISFKENSCCSSCSLRWVDMRRKEWQAGWRPSAEDVAREVARRQARGYRTML